MWYVISRRVMLGACCLLPLASAGAAPPAPYPDKPIRMIVAVPPGGPADTLSRLVSPKLSEAMGQAIVIDNRAGANGNLAYEMTARAVPDGYTFTAVAAGVAINPSLYREVKYDPVKDLAAITQGISVPNILVVHPSVAAQSVAELIAYAKARPAGWCLPRPATVPRGISRSNSFVSRQRRISSTCRTKAAGRP